MRTTDTAVMNDAQRIHDLTQEIIWLKARIKVLEDQLALERYVQGMQ